MFACSLATGCDELDELDEGEADALRVACPGGSCDGPEHPTDLAVAVGVMFFERSCDNPDERAVFTCGATRIGEDLVLTAAHCAQYGTLETRPDRIVVFNDLLAMRTIRPHRRLDCEDPTDEYAAIDALPDGTVAEVDPTVGVYLSSDYEGIPNEQVWAVEDLAVLRVEAGYTLNSTIVEFADPRTLTPEDRFELIGVGTTDCYASNPDHGYVFDKSKASAYGFGVLPLVPADQAGLFRLLNHEPEYTLSFLAGRSFFPAIAPSFDRNAFACNGDSGSGLFVEDASTIAGHRLVGVQSATLPTWLESGDGFLDSSGVFSPSLRSIDACGMFSDAFRGNLPPSLQTLCSSPDPQSRAPDVDYDPDQGGVSAQLPADASYSVVRVVEPPTPEGAEEPLPARFDYDSATDTLSPTVAAPTGRQIAAVYTAVDAWGTERRGAIYMTVCDSTGNCQAKEDGVGPAEDARGDKGEGCSVGGRGRPMPGGALLVLLGGLLVRRRVANVAGVGGPGRSRS